MFKVIKPFNEFAILYVISDPSRNIHVQSYKPLNECAK